MKNEEMSRKAIQDILDTVTQNNTAAAIALDAIFANPLNDSPGDSVLAMGKILKDCDIVGPDVATMHEHVCGADAKFMQLILLGMNLGIIPVCEIKKAIKYKQGYRIDSADLAHRITKLLSEKEGVTMVAVHVEGDGVKLRIGDNDVTLPSCVAVSIGRGLIEAGARAMRNNPTKVH